jgi:thiosulfate dehydrogenase [quinone] large subunit
MLKNLKMYPSIMPHYTFSQITVLVVLRVLIGWHFLYEGVVKILNPNWTSAGYLEESKWLFSNIFHWIINNPDVLRIVDLMNMCGLVAVGLGLITGCLTGFACLGGMMLLFLYYVANPPLIGMNYSMPSEGSYLIVDKNLIELVALVLLVYFPSGNIIGIDRLIFSEKKPE